MESDPDQDEPLYSWAMMGLDIEGPLRRRHIDEALWHARQFIAEWVEVLNRSDPDAIVRRCAIAWARVLGPVEQAIARRDALAPYERDVVDATAQASADLYLLVDRLLRERGPECHGHLMEVRQLRLAYLAELNEVRSRTHHTLLRRIEFNSRLGHRQASIGRRTAEDILRVVADDEQAEPTPRFVYFVLWNVPWAVRQHRLKIGSVSSDRGVEIRRREHEARRRPLFRDPDACSVEVLAWRLGDEYELHKQYAKHRTGNPEEFAVAGALADLVNRMLNKDRRLVDEGWFLP